MKKVVYVGNFSFPNGNAAGKRVYGIGKILRELGYEVLFIGMENDVDGNQPLLTSEDQYEGIRYYNFKYPEKITEWLNFNKKNLQFEELINNLGILNDIEYVIYYDSPSISPFLLKLIKYCKNNNIKVIADVVDWLTVETNNKLFDIGKNFNNWLIKSKINLKVDGVIAISQYLNNYYSEKKLKTITLPPVMTNNIKTKEINKKDFIEKSKKVLVYAGLPFRVGEKNISIEFLKDRIDLIFLHLLQSKKKGYHFIFKVYGFEANDFILAFPSFKDILEELGESVHFYGRVSSEVVEKEILMADFTILYRNSNRASNAGFPTKVSESISNATPVITNNTSDLMKYIKNYKNGFLVDIHNYNSLNKILSLTKEEIWNLKVNCYEFNVFYYKNYIKQLNLFLNEI